MTGEFETSQVLRNLRNSEIDPKLQAHRLLKKLISEDSKNDPNMSICGIKDDKKVMRALFWQTGVMKNFFSKYPEHLLVDCTYKLNNYRYPLLVMLVVDANFSSQIVGIGIIQSENRETFHQIFEQFKETNTDWKKIQTVMVDKSQAEIGAIEESFPECRVGICLFHTLQAMGRKIESVKELKKEERDKAKKYFSDLANARSQKQFEYILNAIRSEPVFVDNGLVDYLDTNWISKSHLWIQYQHETGLNFLDTTNNRIEATFRHLEEHINIDSPLDVLYLGLKTFLNSKYSHDAGVMHNATTRILNDHLVGDKALLKAREEIYRDLPPRTFSKVFQQVLDGISTNTVVESHGANSFTVRASGHRPASATDWSCHCSFHIQTGLPCLHIFAVRHELCEDLYHEDLPLPRWKKKNWLRNPAAMRTEENYQKTGYQKSYIKPSDKYNMMVRRLSDFSSTCSDDDFMERSRDLQKLLDIWDCKKKAIITIASNTSEHNYSQYPREPFSCSSSQAEEFEVDEGSFELPSSSSIIDESTDEENESKVIDEHGTIDNDYDFVFTKREPSGPKPGERTAIGLLRKRSKPSLLKKKIGTPLETVKNIEIRHPATIPTNRRSFCSPASLSELHQPNFAVYARQRMWVTWPYQIFEGEKSLFKPNDKQEYPWITNTIVNWAMARLNSNFTHFSGLMNIDALSHRQSFINFDCRRGDRFCQIFLIDNHYVLVTSESCQTDSDGNYSFQEFNVYDSLNSISILEKQMLISSISSMLKFDE